MSHPEPYRSAIATPAITIGRRRVLAADVLCWLRSRVLGRRHAGTSRRASLPPPVPLSSPGRRIVEEGACPAREYAAISQALAGSPLYHRSRRSGPDRGTGHLLGLCECFAEA